MSDFGRLGLAVGLLLVLVLVLTAQARADDETNRRVAMFRALVRNEPLPAFVPEPPEEAPPPVSDPQTPPVPLEPVAEAPPVVEHVFHCSAPLPENRVRLAVRRAVLDASLRYAVPRALIRSVIRHESAYEPEALSPAGAMGLMQLMPGTARQLGVVCPYDPRQNVLAGTRYLRGLRDRFGSWRRALAAYNAGPTAVLEDRIPPITHLYVRRVLAGWNGRFDGM